MTLVHTRRNLLRGDLANRGDAVMRPPGAQPGFERLCDDCGACARACPQKIVRRDARGGPVLDFARGACTFCGDCARACPTGALRAEDPADWPWRARILETCLSLQGVSCRACEDACEARAISFRLRPGGRALPVLEAESCTGCGECAATCPSQSITFERSQPARAEETA
jgi:ferredoxin-type protein NapF